MAGRGAGRVRAVVVGGGVIGCAVLRELTGRGIEALLVESEPDLCEGTSKANSAIVHTGFDSKAGTVESTMLRRAAALWPAVIEELGVPHLALGALMLARSADERARLEREIAPNAAALGVRTELLGARDLRSSAPYVTDDAVAALAIPDEAVIDPFWLTRAYAESAIAGGGSVLLGRAVVELEPGQDTMRVRLDDGTDLVADQVIDCAGIRADEVARLAGDDSFSIAPRKGQFLISEETFGVERIVLPIPGPMGKGMLVTPIIFGGVLLGPTATDGDDKTDLSIDAEGRALILGACRSLVPAVADMTPIRQFAGLRHVSSTGDFILRPATATDRLYLAAGMRSTGVSTSPAVAEAVVAEVGRLRGWTLAAPPRSFSPPALELPDEPGEVTCLCRGIGRAEIEAACRRPTAPSTVDAIKRRGGATFGDCQGALCLPAVVSVVAAERGLVRTAIVRHRAGSWLFAAEVPPTTAEMLPATAGTIDAEIAVVGGGLAGIGAVLAALDRGLRPVMLERRTRPGGAFRAAPDALTGDERAALARFRGARLADRIDVRTGATAIGLVEEGEAWLLLGQAAAGRLEVRARAIVIATGGFVEPREHRPVAGPRPAGIATADLVHEALDAGLVPGHRAVVVGAGRYADATIVRMRGAGIEVAEVIDPVSPDRPVDEVRGDRRLDAVRRADAWFRCDSLVLAHRLVPQPFLLRGLGLIDGRSGVPAPVRDDGALGPAGLWAAGTCAGPDIDHRRSLEDGLRVGLGAAAGVRDRV